MLKRYKAHPVYNNLVLEDSEAPEGLAQTFCVAGSRVPIMLVEAGLALGMTVEQLLEDERIAGADPWRLRKIAEVWAEQRAGEPVWPPFLVGARSLFPNAA